MSEQAPQSDETFQDHPEAYIEIYPEAIVDPNKAMVMASASHNQEKMVVEARKQALWAASNLGDENYRKNNVTEGNKTAEQQAKYQIAEAEHARIQADKHSATAAEIYDKVKNL